MEKKDLLRPDRVVEHIDITDLGDLDQLLERMSSTSFQARNLARAAEIYERALRDDDCLVVLCLAGSLVSAGLKKVLADLVRSDMVDAIVSTGANVVDQDFFEGLGFRHYRGDPQANDEVLRELEIDRIYDHYIDEAELRICDSTVTRILDGLEPRPYSSRELVGELGRYLSVNGKDHSGFVEACFDKAIPVFVPAFQDCSAGFGFVEHQHARLGRGEPMVTLDAARDFLDLTYLKMHCAKHSALIMVGGGVPKNFAQDIVVAADVLGEEVPMHRYAVQLTVADERDGALSGSTLQEATSWGKVDSAFEQMVYGEATVTLPLLVGAVYARAAHKERSGRRLAECFRADGSFDHERANTNLASA